MRADPDNYQIGVTMMAKAKAEKNLGRVYEERPRGVRIDAAGREIPDPVPCAPPVGYEAPSSLIEMVRNAVRSEMIRDRAASMGKESFEDADDFEVGDDYDPSSPYENDFDPEIKTLIAEGKKSIAEKKAAAEKKARIKAKKEKARERGSQQKPARQADRQMDLKDRSDV